MEHNITYFENMPAMKYYNNEDDTNQKRRDMIENKDNKYIASEKHDGDRSLLIHYEKGHNLIRSRSISKKTGKYGDYTEKLPHLVEEMDNWPDKSVVLAEICWDEPNTTANTVGTILRCLSAKAVERQKEHKLKALIFDVLMWDGVDMMDWLYENRLAVAASQSALHQTYLYPTQIFTDNFDEAADEIIRNGGEGVVIQLKDNPYMPDSRTAWKTLKLKKKMDEVELKVLSTIEPNKNYEGDYLENWKFFDEEGHPVTKPYYMGWKNGVIVDFNGVEVKVTSGLTDEDRAWLATDEAAELIKSGDLYAKIRAMSINSQKSLRHPYLNGFRTKEDGANEAL